MNLQNVVMNAVRLRKEYLRKDREKKDVKTDFELKRCEKRKMRVERFVKHERPLGILAKFLSSDRAILHGPRAGAISPFWRQSL